MVFVVITTYVPRLDIILKQQTTEIALTEFMVYSNSIACKLSQENRPVSMG